MTTTRDDATARADRPAHDDARVSVDAAAAGGQPATPSRLRGRGVAVAGVAAVVLLGATVGQPVVAQVLDQFRTEQVRPVTVEPGTVAAELDELEDIATVTEVTSRSVAGSLDDLDRAAALAGVPAPDLVVLGDVGDLAVEATGEIGARVAFDATDDVPPRLRGVVVQVTSPGALVIGGPDRGLVVARARPLEVTAEGASLDDVRDALLTEVELPPTLRDQLAAIDDWRTALPVPVPVDTSLWDEVEVAGTPGLAIGHGDVGAVVWQDEQLVQAVGGERSVDELLAIAADL